MVTEQSQPQNNGSALLSHPKCEGQVERSVPACLVKVHSEHCTCFCSRTVPRSWLGLPCCPQLPVLRRTPAGGKHLRVGPGQSLGGSYWYHLRDPKSPQYLQGCGTHSAYRETSLHTFFIFINQSLKKIPTYPCFLPSVTTKTTII